MPPKKWFSKLVDLGCIVCREEGIYSPPDIHHIHRNGRRVDDLHTIPLCPAHHRLGYNTPRVVSRHPYKAEFERRYGSEWDLFKKVVQIVSEAP